MTDEELNIELKLSYYKEIGVLSEEHGVYLVQHVETSKTYVKKVRKLYNPEVYKQLREHPVAGVPRIFDFFEKDGKLIVIEEYISGTDLSSYLKEHGAFSEKETVEFGIMLCDILSRIHSLTPPIIHRDIKPSNIMLTDDKRIILLDLNSAKPVTKGQKQDTLLLGTHGFAAPEQYGFGASNVQTDLYAVGILLKVMLSGFDDKDSGIFQNEPIIKCSAKLLSVIDKCTQLSPDKRYSSAIELKDALLKCQNKPTFKPVYSLIACMVLIVVVLTVCIVKALQKNDKTTITPEPSVTEEITPETTPDASPTPTTPAPSPSPTEIPADDGLNLNSPVGTYEGNDKEKLVISANGLAYYYCVDVEFTEVECPWTYKDNKLTITLSLMHCDITADIKSDFSELTLKTDSYNWNTEVFTKVSADAESFILDPPPSANEMISVLSSGEKVFELEGIRFTVPKHFRMVPDESYNSYLGLNSRGRFGSVSTKYIILLDTDVGYNDPYDAFEANIISYPISINFESIKSDPKSAASQYMSSFLDNLQVTYTEEPVVGGRNSVLVTVSGTLNSGFGELYSNIYTGYVVFIPTENPDRVLSLQMLQRVGTKNNDEESFRFVLENAVGIE
ncbi:MAG: serine/threonine protein kinase [Lachnospiraceae bacterium]|nr:serine/threonine protein kinase [Lachnospiraceae bacterium]